MKRLVRFSVLVLALVATGQGSASAQGNGESFFKQDFAGSPLDNSGAEPKPQHSSKATMQVAPNQPTAGVSFGELEAPEQMSSVEGAELNVAPTVSAVSSTSKWSSVDSATKEERSGSTSLRAAAGSSISRGLQQAKSDPQDSASDVVDMARGIKIERLGLVANFINESHALEALTSYREVLVKHSIEPGTVYMIGITPGFMLDPLINMVKRLQFLGARFASNQISPPVPVKLSPSWIIETATGRYLLEGTMELERFLNSRGEFLKPGDTESLSAIAAPDPGANTTPSAMASSARAESVSSASASERTGIVPDLN